MIFFRYQNTKTLERYSFHYVDMNTLYDRASSHIDMCKDKYTDITVDSISEYLYDYTYELCYRQNLEENDYSKIIKEISKICLKYYTDYKNIELKKTFRKKAWQEITDLMKPYPLKGLFVIPEYTKLFNHGTKFSISELRSNIITGLSAESAKYLAIYEGEVICEEVEYGGTLIKPTKLLGTFDLFEEKDKYIGNRHVFYRDIKNEYELQEEIQDNREWIQDNINWNMSQEHINKLIKIHAKELLIYTILRKLKTSYKKLDYYKEGNIHKIRVFKDDRTFYFNILDEDITLDNFTNRDNITYRCKLVVKDLSDNIINKGSGTLSIKL